MSVNYYFAVIDRFRRLFATFAAVSHRTWWMVTVVAAACGGGSTQDILPDAGTITDAAVLTIATPDEGDLALDDFVAGPEAPRRGRLAVAPPRAGPCPSGWLARPLGDGEACEPPPTPTCASGLHADARSVCRRFGGSCPVDGWPQGLPEEATVLYVDAAAASGGDGAKTAPLRTIPEAVAAASAGTIIALRAGEHRAEALTLSRDLILWGACASGTQVAAQTVDEERPVVQVEGRATLRELTVLGPRPGIQVGRAGSETPMAGLQLDAVVIRDVVRRGLFVGANGVVAAENLWIRGVETRPSNGAAGHFWVMEGGTAWIRDAVFEDGGRVGIVATDGADLTLEDAAVRRVALDSAGRGQGMVAAFGAHVSIARTIFEDVYEYALYVSDQSRLDAVHLAVRDVVAFGRPAPLGAALLAERDGQLRVQGGTIRRVGPSTVAFSGSRSTMELTDLWLAELDTPIARASAFLAESGARLDAERLWIDAAGGLSYAGDGTIGAVQHLTMRTQDDAPSAAVVVRAGAATVTATAVDVRGAPGVGVFSPRAFARVRGLRVGLEGRESFGAYVSLGRLEVAEVDISDSEDQAVTADSGGLLIGEDIVVRRSFRGITTTQDGELQLERVVVEAPKQTGLSVIGGRSRIDDVRIARLTGEGRRPVAVSLAGGATVTIDRMTLVDVNGDGLLVTGGARLTARDVALTARSPTDGFDLGVAVSAGAGLLGERVAVRNYAAGVLVSGEATLADVAVSGRTSPDDGISLGGRGRIAVRRARLFQRTGYGIFMYGDGRLDGEDMVIEDLSASQLDVAVGVAAIDTATVAIERLRVVGTRTASAYGADRSRLLLTDARLMNAVPATCSPQVCGLAGVASGLYLRDRSRGDLTRFGILRAATAGIILTEGAAVDAREGEIAECAIGLLVANPDFDLDRIADRVVFRDNVRDALIDQADVPRIEPVRPEEPGGRGD